MRCPRYRIVNCNSFMIAVRSYVLLYPGSTFLLFSFSLPALHLHPSCPFLPSPVPLPTPHLPRPPPPSLGPPASPPRLPPLPLPLPSFAPLPLLPALLPPQGPLPIGGGDTPAGCQSRGAGGPGDEGVSEETLLRWQRLLGAATWQEIIRR